MPCSNKYSISVLLQKLNKNLFQTKRDLYKLQVQAGIYIFSHCPLSQLIKGYCLIRPLGKWLALSARLKRWGNYRYFGGKSLFGGMKQDNMLYISGTGSWRVTSLSFKLCGQSFYLVESMFYLHQPASSKVEVRCVDHRTSGFSQKHQNQKYLRGYCWCLNDHFVLSDKFLDLFYLLCFNWQNLSRGQGLLYWINRKGKEKMCSNFWKCMNSYVANWNSQQRWVEG